MSPKEPQQIQQDGACWICGEPYEGYGHSPRPLGTEYQRVCSLCNSSVIIPARLHNFNTQASDG